MIYELFRGNGRGVFRLRGDFHAMPVRRDMVIDAVVEVPDGEEEDAFYWLRQTNPRPMNEMPDFGAWREVCARRGVHVSPPFGTADEA